MVLQNDEAVLATHLKALLVASPYSRASTLKVLPGAPRKPSEVQSVTGAVPHECLFVLGTGGLNKIPFVDGGERGGILRPTFQIWVRSKVRDYDGGRALALDAFDAIDMQPPTGFIECRAQGSAPIYVEEDDTNHHAWAINLWCMRH